jgi:hypothetical protein
MILLVSGATATVRRLRVSPELGVLFVPGAWTRGDPSRALWPGASWAVDNGAFKAFDAPAFLNLLARLQGVPGCRFVAAPDVLEDADATGRLFATWEPLIRVSGFPVALVGQDGLTLDGVPWDAIDALFLGGSTAWKLGPMARRLAAYARARGKWVHMGRVNSRRRLHYAERIGCQSVDGTKWSRWPDQYLPKALRWVRPLPLFQ